ncbi:MAG: TonB-dependent receptor [Alistipes sp.]|nr:TonB-dependent receptor [Alistipes sp.]
MAQNRMIQGTVTDESGEPIVGAAVIVDGTTTGASTNADGRFAISAPADATLTVSYLGFEAQRVRVNNQTNLKIALKEDSHALDEVIVVAFGQSTKESFTGSATVVKAEDIAKTQAGNAAQSLAGKVAGVQLVNSSGQPGSAPSIHIRGFGSISAGNSPLYVLDGMPYEGDLSNINPSDIESMTVLKDAASNALYGARGANGVIMITTKKGKHGDAQINLDMKWGVNSRAVKEYDFISDPAQYYETHYKALYNYARYRNNTTDDAHKWALDNLFEGSYGLGYQSFTVPAGQDFIGTDGRLNPNATLGYLYTPAGSNESYMIIPDNWNKEGYRTSLRQEYNISVSGQNEKSNFYASLGYLDDQGIVNYSNMRRLTGRLRADYQAKKWLKVGGNVGYSHFVHNSLNDEGNSGSSGNLFTLTSRVAPIYPVYLRDAEGKIRIDENGYKMYDYGDGRGYPGISRPVMSQSNPMSSYMLDTSRGEGNAFNGNIFADFRIIDGLTVTINAAASLDETRWNFVTNPYYGQYANSNGIAEVDHSRQYAYNLQQLINYSKTFNEKHNFDLLAGHEYYVSKNYSLYGYNTNMFSQSNKELNGAITTGSTGSSYDWYNTEGYFFRAQYNYDERVFLNASYRRDASSRFHPDHRWGNFWSLGAAWLIDRESWFNADWVDMLKVKASYGEQGNDNIGQYLYLDRYTITQSNGQAAVIFASRGNDNITWETNANLNVGLEFELLKSRIGGSIEYFHRKTYDMLFSRPVPRSSGYSSYMDNIGDMVNSGVEIDLHLSPVVTKDFRWDFNVNATFLKNRVTLLPPEKQGGFANGSYWLEEGKPYYTFYMRKYAGVDPATGQSLWWKDDPNGDGRVATSNYSDATYYQCGAADPDAFGGFGTTLSWKGLDFSINFTYQIGGQVYDSGYAALMSSPQSGDTGSNIHKDILKAWTPENRNSNIPRWQLADQYSASQSDRFLTSASFLNLQNINVGYTLPRSFTRKFMVEKLRIYLACDNVCYWSKRQGLDPRQSWSGSTSSELYSPVRTVSAGINVTF